MKIEQKFELVDVARLYASATNPRKSFDFEGMEKLRDSISESGIHQPLIVRLGEGETFEIVAGERRWRVARELKLAEVPVIVRELSDLEVLEIQLVENVQRESLTPGEESEGVLRMREAGLDGAGISRVLGKNVEWVQLRMDLGRMPVAVRDAVSAGRLRVESVASMMRVDEAARESFGQEVLEMGEVLTREQVEEMVWERYDRPKKNRALWSEICEDFNLEAADALGDPELWFEYVRPYGEAFGDFKLWSDPVGGLSAKAEESIVTWGALAKLHGVRGLFVPVGGVKPGLENVVLVVDRTKIEAAERGSRLAGGPFVLGPRAARVELEPEPEPEAEKKELRVSAVVKPEKLYPVIEDIRALRWNPWAIAEEGLSESAATVARVIVDVLDESDEKWLAVIADILEIEREDLLEFGIEEFGGVHVLAVWWILWRIEEKDKRRGLRIASALGLRDFWMERGFE
jgi:ParB/RepB/Spo0J family partition protein